MILTIVNVSHAPIVKFNLLDNVSQVAMKNHIVLIALVNFLLKDVLHVQSQLLVSHS
jgi:hypothetical protein